MAFCYIILLKFSNSGESPWDKVSNFERSFFMKRIVGALLTLFLAFSAPVVSLAEEEIYWGQAPPTSSNITEDDFSIDFEKPQDLKTFGDQEIYDTYKAKDLAPEPQNENETNAASQPSAPIQPEPVVRTAPPIRTNIGAPSSTQRQAPTNTGPARVVPATPKPAETTPGSSRPASNAETAVNSNNQPSPTNEEVDRPSTKKMKWGQTESGADESSAKFQWGKKNQ